MASELEKLIIGIAAASIIGGILFGRMGALVGAACASILFGSDTKEQIAAGYRGAANAPPGFASKASAFLSGMGNYLPNDPDRAADSYLRGLQRSRAFNQSRRVALRDMGTRAFNQSQLIVAAHRQQALLLP